MNSTLDKSFIFRFAMVSGILLATLLISCNRDEENIERGEKTLELINLVESNPNIKSLLIKSIDQAATVNPDRITNPAQSLEEYYDFVAWAEKAMPWSILKNIRFSSLYDKIDQSLNYFYFINDQPLEELEGMGFYNNSLQYVKPYSDWLVSFNRSWGNYLDTPESWKEEYYQMALADSKFGLSNDWYEDPSTWKTFNQFFARYLKSPDRRPIGSPADNTVVVSPADAKPQGVWEIDSESQIVLSGGVPIKSGTLTSIKKLIGEESSYADAFANGIMTHTFLDVHDYHRYHFPLAGVVKEVRVIYEQEAAGGIVTWDPVNQRYMFDPTVPGWQAIETRGCVILDTEEYGLVALLPIGMSQVCSVNFESNIKAGTRVKKGDMLGYFLFGGSDFVMIFQPQAGFELQAPTDSGNPGAYKHILVGERYGLLKGTGN